MSLQLGAEPRTGAAFVALVGLAVACGDASDPAAPAAPSPYATEVVAFEPGDMAGFGQAMLPEIVLGPPAGLGPTAGSLDVLSLGAGGWIVLGFEAPIVDGPGPDLIVFENAFYADGDPSLVFAELGRVAVSEDGARWREFACDPHAGPPAWPGCAGWRPTLMFDPVEVQPLDAALTGGDPFDLAEVGLTRARFVRIEDLSQQEPLSPTAGFDLDAVGVIRR